MADSQRLSVETLEELLPGDVITIGSQEIVIKPLGLLSLSNIFRKLKKFIEEMKDSGITLDNCKSPENIFYIATELLERFPDVLQQATNIHIDDIKMLPVEIVVQLIDKVIEVNMKSNESFMGNLASLTGRFQGLFPKEKKQTKKGKKIKK